MYTPKKASLILLLLLGSSAMVAARNTGTRLIVGFQGGYNGGPGIRVNGMLTDFAREFPLQIQLSAAFNSVPAGNAADARRIFINEATNGTSRKSGRQSTYSVDFLYPMEFLSRRTYLSFGPRYAMYKANFKYIGGNEDFDVTSRQWGAGIGMASYFTISSRANLVLSLGVDHYLQGTLSGHDTSYSPDGEDVNPRNDYTWNTADKAIDQPRQRARVNLGLSYELR